MDPREIVHQIRRDFESRPRAAAAVAVLFAAGVAAWIPVIGARGSGAMTSPRQASVLSDPFNGQTK